MNSEKGNRVSAIAKFRRRLARKIAGADSHFVSHDVWREKCNLAQHGRNLENGTIPRLHRGMEKQSHLLEAIRQQLGGDQQEHGFTLVRAIARLQEEAATAQAISRIADAPIITGEELPIVEPKAYKSRRQ